MLKFLLPLLLATFIISSSAIGGDNASEPDRPLVLVELFTSQGCANCPQANKFLAELAAQENVIAMSLAVDYWDYLGWKDTFAMAKFTHRQAAYRDAMQTRRPYTPQMIINGQASIKGTRENKVRKQIAKIAKAQIAKAQGITPKISLTRFDDQLRLTVGAGQVPQNGAVLWMADYIPGVQQVEVAGGENAGKTLDQVNMVTNIRKIGTWSGEELVMNLPQMQTGSCIVILQEAGHGRVLAVARLPV